MGIRDYEKDKSNYFMSDKFSSIAKLIHYLTF